MLIDNITRKLCLQCIDSSGIHDPFTTWQVTEGNNTLSLSNSVNIVGQLEVLQGYLEIVNPYSRLTDNKFSVVCDGVEFTYIRGIYSSGKNNT